MRTLHAGSDTMAKSYKLALITPQSSFGGSYCILQDELMDLIKEQLM